MGTEGHILLPREAADEKLLIHLCERCLSCAEAFRYNEKYLDAKVGRI